MRGQQNDRALSPQLVESRQGFGLVCRVGEANDSPTISRLGSCSKAESIEARTSLGLPERKLSPAAAQLVGPRTSPASGVLKLAASSSSSDLPAPFGPVRPTMIPSMIDSLISRCRSPCRHCTSRNSSGMDGEDSTFYRRGQVLLLIRNALAISPRRFAPLDPRGHMRENLAFARVGGIWWQQQKVTWLLTWARRVAARFWER